MGFKAEIVGGKGAFLKVAHKFDEISKRTEEEVIQSTQLTVLTIHSHAVKSIADQKGDPAVRYKPRRNVTVSKPGDPPNTDTGRLAQSIQFEFENGGLVGIVGTSLKYGAWLEFGTQHIKPRPWLRPAVRKTQSELGRRPYIKNVTGILQQLGRKK